MAGSKKQDRKPLFSQAERTERLIQEIEKVFNHLTDLAKPIWGSVNSTASHFRNPN
jgi:hypothetical protein